MKANVRRNHVSRAKAVVAIGLSFSGLAVTRAHAQDSARQLTDVDASDIVVTGSRIQRDGLQSSTPLTVVSRGQLIDAAPSSISDALNQLPQFQLSSKPSSAGPSANNNAGGNFLNLRALGVSRTLVLIDGRRGAPSNSTSATDINLIPQSLVERVDVVTGGASAAYGSDAVAGVVNFILDTDFEGLKAEAQAGVSTYGDDASKKVNLTGGTSLLGGRAHIVFSAEYSDRDGFQRPNGRDWAEASYGPISSASGRPTILITPNAAISNGSYGGLVINGPFANQQFLPGGVLAPFVYGTERTATTMIGGDGVRDIAGLPTSLTYGTLFAHLTVDLGSDIEIFAEGTLGRSRTRFLSTNLNTTGANDFVILAENAYLPATLRAQLGATPSFRLGRIDRDFGRPNFLVRNQAVNLVGGFRAKLGGSWRADGYYEHGETTQRIQTRSNPIYENLYRAADAVRDSQDAIVCRSTLTNPNDGCVPINLFGEGAPSPEALAYVNGTSWSRQVVKQHVVAAQIAGEPFALPAGPVSLVVGAEYRHVSTRQISDAVSRSTIADTTLRGLPAALVGKLGGFYLTNPQPSAGSYDIKEGFAEIAVPLLRDTPFFHSLELNGAIRYTDYSTSGGVTTWKVGGTWEPFEDLRLRGTRSRDIRAGNFGELFAGTTQSQGLLRDPQANNAQVRFFSRRAGNPDLAPEVADTLTGGFVYRPSWFDGFSLSVDAFRIDIDNAIALPSPQEVINACAAGSTEQCALVSRAPDGTLQAVITPFQNAASVKLRGFDIETGFRTSLGDGQITIRGLASIISKNETTLRGGVPVDRAGDLGNSIAAITNGTPKVSGTLSLNYENGPFVLYLQERFIAASKYDHLLVEGVGINDNSIPAVFYTDATVRYRIGEQKWFEIFATINNLFNREPPPAPSVTTATFYPTNNFVYDLTGRYFTAGVRLGF